MVKGLFTRRFVGFIITMIAMVIKPEAAPYLAGIYGALISAAVADTIKGVK